MKLKNRSRRAQILNLPHDVVCVDGECLCTSVEHRSLDHNPNTGEVGVRTTDRLVAASLHLTPGATSEELTDRVKDVPEIAAALKAKRLEVC